MGQYKKLEKPLYIIKVVKFPEKKYDKQEPTRRRVLQ
jgi:hypothetical protein